jgi:hypothetical protein
MNATPAEITQTAAEEPATQPAEPGLTSEEHAERQARIAERAYHLAMARGFTPGRELDDWLAAERALEDHDVAEAG